MTRQDLIINLQALYEQCEEFPGAQVVLLSLVGALNGKEENDLMLVVGKYLDQKLCKKDVNYVD